jgi:chemotaxis protein methyltransferase CheR
MIEDPHQLPSDAELDGLCEDLLAGYQHDFRHYARASLARRVALAMQRLNVPDVTALRQRLSHDRAAFGVLFSHLTVQVSEMFRDARYYLALRSQVVPLLATYPSFKIWVAGCATGEEAYSLAIVLAEAGLLARAVIYATDIGEAGLEEAAAGRFALDRMAGHSQNYRNSGGQGSLADFYVAAYGHAVMDPGLRKKIVFSEHSLATDEIFSEVDVVSCRNVLIYFDRVLQERALGLFHGALSRRGFLGLGSRETVRFSTVANEFDELPDSDRWYRKRA